MKTYKYDGEIVLSIYTNFQGRLTTYFVRLYTEGKNHGITIGDFNTKEKAEIYIDYVVKILNLKEINDINK